MTLKRLCYFYFVGLAAISLVQIVLVPGQTRTTTSTWAEAAILAEGEGPQFESDSQAVNPPAAVEVPPAEPVFPPQPLPSPAPTLIPEPTEPPTPTPGTSPTPPSPSHTPTHNQLSDVNDLNYHNLQPEFGVQLTFSPNAFGGHALVTSQGTSAAYALVVAGQYQPVSIQKYGILGVGPSITFYPLSGAASSITNNAFSLISAGAEIRYQARYFRKQPLVPVVGYSAEYFSYTFLGGPSGGLILKGPVFGLWILLNIVEPRAAADFYVDNKVLRTYLTLEARNLSGSNKDLTISGYSYYAGLRFEF